LALQKKGKYHDGDTSSFIESCVDVYSIQEITTISILVLQIDIDIDNDPTIRRRFPIFGCWNSAAIVVWTIPLSFVSRTIPLSLYDTSNIGGKDLPSPSSATTSDIDDDLRQQQQPSTITTNFIHHSKWWKENH
jgi:hypothetical protein